MTAPVFDDLTETREGINDVVEIQPAASRLRDFLTMSIEAFDNSIRETEWGLL